MPDPSLDNPDSLEAIIKRDLSQLRQKREQLVKQRSDIDEQIAAVDRRVEAAQLYQAAVEGKVPTTVQRSPASRRGRRGGVRDAVLDIVKKHPQGIRSADVQEQMNATEKNEKQSIANALAALKRSETITLQDGIYRPA